MTQKPSPAGWLVENWCNALARVLGSLTGAPPRISFRLAEPPGQRTAAAPDTLWWEQPLSLEGRPAVYVGATAPAWRQIGERVLRASGVESPTDADTRSSFLEVLSQSLAGLAASLGNRLGKEVRCEGGQEVLEEPECGAGGEIELTLESAPSLALRLMAAPELLRALEPAVAGQELAVTAPAGPPAQADQPPRTLELLMEVELPVSVSFGRAELPLKDVLKLTTGSIVELNRTVEEPVELIVNNCVIARGQVVVVDGNYGVRIEQIISPQERLRTLK